MRLTDRFLLFCINPLQSHHVNQTLAGLRFGTIVTGCARRFQQMTTSTVYGKLDSQAIKFLAGCTSVYEHAVPATSRAPTGRFPPGLGHSLGFAPQVNKMMRTSGIALAAEILAPLKRERLRNRLSRQGWERMSAIFRSPRSHGSILTQDVPRESRSEKIRLADHFTWNRSLPTPYRCTNCRARPQQETYAPGHA